MSHAGVGVSALAEHQLVAALAQGDRQRLDDFAEDTAHQRGNQRRDEPAFVRAQAAGQQVRNVTGPGDRLLHLGQCRLGHAVRCVHRARNGHCGDACNPCHVVHGHVGGTTLGACSCGGQ